VFCGFGILACQTRSVVFPWVLSLGVFTIIVIARYKSKGIAGVLIVSLAACAVLAARAKSFGYVFTKHIVATDTLDFRKNVAWPQLYPIFKQFPLTGIGPDWRFTYYRFSKTSRTALSADKFVRWGSFDGSYHHLLATLGIVGVVIFAFVILTALAGSMKVALDRAESAERRNLAIATFMMICTLLVIFATFEDMWWKESMWPVLIALGLASRTRAETIHYMGRAGQTATETAWRRVLGVFTGQAPAKLKV
jgi:hypothetical protein